MKAEHVIAIAAAVVLAHRLFFRRKRYDYGYDAFDSAKTTTCDESEGFRAEELEQAANDVILSGEQLATARRDQEPAALEPATSAGDPEPAQPPPAPTSPHSRPTAGASACALPRQPPSASRSSESPVPYLEALPASSFQVRSRDYLSNRVKVSRLDWAGSALGGIHVDRGGMHVDR